MPAHKVAVVDHNILKRVKNEKNYSSNKTCISVAKPYYPRC